MRKMNTWGMMICVMCAVVGMSWCYAQTDENMDASMAGSKEIAGIVETISMDDNTMTVNGETVYLPEGFFEEYSIVPGDNLVVLTVEEEGLNYLTDYYYAEQE